MASRQAARLLGCILVCFAVFAVWPQIDLGVSKAFHDPGTGFAIQGHPFTEALRMTAWNFSIVVCPAAAVGTALGAAGRTVLLPARAWGFILTLYNLAPGLMVEMLTKPLWGRGRPAQVVDFGGPFPFSPPNELVDFCARNCSFVSGEVSGATVTALALLILRAHLGERLGRVGSAAMLVTAWGLPPAVALQRMASGRHFLSDAVFAVLFTLLIALAVSALLRPVPHQIRAERSG